MGSVCATPEEMVIRSILPSLLGYKHTIELCYKQKYVLIEKTPSWRFFSALMSKKSKSGNFNLKVKRALTGKGLFAMDPIPKGAFIIEYTGKTVPEKYHGTATGKYLFWTGRNIMIDGNVSSNTARYINHSCKPNCEADGPRGHVYIRARRNIKAGEELTYDYGGEYFDEYIKPKGCKCVKCYA